MSDRERTGQRSLIYSNWHRIDNIRRYLPSRDAWGLGLIDIDGCEYCRHCRKPLALTETMESDQSIPKAAPVMARLAQMAGIPAFSVVVQAGDADLIAMFYVQQIEPPRQDIRPMRPHEYAKWLAEMRHNHTCEEKP